MACPIWNFSFFFVRLSQMLSLARNLCENVKWIFAKMTESSSLVLTLLEFWSNFVCNGFRTPGQLLEEVLLVDDFSLLSCILIKLDNDFRTPGQLLEEVLLVDDFSDRPELGSGLENYIKIFRGSVRYGHKVHIYLEYHKVCLLVRIGTRLSHKRMCPSPEPKGGHARLRVRGRGGVPILSVCLLCVHGYY